MKFHRHPRYLTILDKETRKKKLFPDEQLGEITELTGGYPFRSFQISDLQNQHERSTKGSWEQKGTSG